MLDLPYHIPLVFILTTLFTLVLFLISLAVSKDPVIQKRAHLISLLLLLWTIFQSTLALNAWYMDRVSVPPHITFPVITFTVIIVSLFLLPGGRRILDGFSMKMLVWIHIARIPVELCLYWLAGEKQVPVSMTFEGSNFDIIFGITAPIIALMYFKWKLISDRIFLIWNVLGLISLLAIVIRAAGATPTKLQAWDFQQPNYAVLHFPFIWLPSVIVPLVLLTHLIVIRRFVLKKGM